MTEQLGTGQEQQYIVLSTKPTIATLPVTATTADIAALGTAVNAILSALRTLKLVS